METVNGKRIVDEAMPPKSGKAVELKKGLRPLDVMVPCNAFNCTPLRVEVFET